MKALITLATAAGLALLIIIFGSMYTVNEGHVAVITKWDKAVKQERPNGLQFKMPLIVGVEEFDVRERVITGTLNAGTSDRLSTTVEFSVNWRPAPDEVLSIYRKYGSPDDFAQNVIKTRLSQALKSVIGKFSGAQLIREREVVAEAMLVAARKDLANYPAVVASVQVENFDLPGRYMEAILQTEEQRAATAKEDLILQQQAISARRDVQTAEADRDSAIARADGKAYATRTQAAAQAEATVLAGVAKAKSDLAIYEARAKGQQAIAKALGSGALAVEYSRNIAWNGTLPTTILGNSPALMMEMPQ